MPWHRNATARRHSSNPVGVLFSVATWVTWGCYLVTRKQIRAYFFIVWVGKIQTQPFKVEGICGSMGKKPCTKNEKLKCVLKKRCCSFKSSRRLLDFIDIPVPQKITRKNITKTLIWPTSPKYFQLSPRHILLMVQKSQTAKQPPGIHF